MTVLIGGYSDGKRVDSDAPSLTIPAPKGGRDQYELELLRAERRTFYFYRHADMDIETALAALLDGYRVERKERPDAPWISPRSFRG
jgi:hypothetical protein